MSEILIESIVEDAALAWLESVGRRLRNGANAGAGAPAVAAAQRSE